MLKRVLVLSLVLMIPACVFAATTGKIIGQVTDKATGEALPGANVIVEGTSRGAATNVDGGFIILNVPPGIYTVTSTFIGYETVKIGNIRVSVDLTTEVNFQLPTEAIEVESISITAERPLVNKNATNETHIMTADDIENMPIRSYAGVVSTASGVVAARAQMYVRGGRADEMAYYVDGVYTNDLRTGQRVGDVPVNSLEQINYQAGGFNAEYGFANSGVVIASSKSGGSNFNLTGEVITDEFLSRKNQSLGTYSYGYNVYNMSLSGPVVSNKVKFFVSGEKSYLADRRPSAGEHPVLDGDFTSEEILYRTQDMDSLGIPLDQRLLPVRMQGGIVPNNYLDRWAVNGNLLFDLNPVRFKLGGNATFDKQQIYSNAFSLVNYDHNQLQENYNYSGYGKITHTLGARTFYEGTLYYSEFKQEWGDPIFWRNMMDYGDKDDVNNNGKFTPELPGASVVGYAVPRLGQGIFTPPVTFTQYHLNRASVLGAKFDFTHQQNNHEIRTGFEYRYNTLRRYALIRPWALASTIENEPNIDRTLLYRTGYTESFGYPAYFAGDNVDPSQTSDEGLDDAQHPMLGAFYIQDKIELADLVLNLGLRFDYVNANDQRLVDPYNVKITNGLIDQSTLEDTEAHMSVSPRLGLSFPVTDKTVFHAQFGKFTQQPELRYLYTGWNYLAAQLSQGNQVEVGNPDLRPVTTTAYEIGIGQQLGINSSISLTAYYKEIADLIVLKNRVNAKPITYAQYQNGDYGTIKGLSFTYRLRRTKGLTANLNYTLQYASGTGSTSNSNFYVTWIGQEYYPTFVAPLAFDQRHTASINLDYRFGGDASPVFRDMGINLLASLGSGFPYTPKRVADTIWGARFSTAFPVAATNSSYSNWTHRIDLRWDKSFTIASQKLNVYLWVINLLGSKMPFNQANTRNSIDMNYGGEYAAGIYEATGRPDENGWLATENGKSWVETSGGANAEAMYRAGINSPNNWEEPRQIRLGVRFEIAP
ncbi:TonB-dependent receptor [candidate division KSB1 bacterium]|nr:TonB-dependent receptor [candidate division KSB1 bacterium]RQW05670.1 MAG: TonB-dependent receptor [candidate division KSB1 bacterium]